MHLQREAIIRSLFENMHTMKRGMAAHMFSQDCPISPAQVELLFAVRHTQPVSFKRLAEALHMTSGAVSQMAEGLEQREFISRRADEHDRRIQCLQVSKKGSRLLDTIEKRREHIMGLVVQGLTDEELAVWLKVQEKMMQHFQAELAKQTKKETV